jgi:hypothetical protein
MITTLLWDDGGDSNAPCLFQSRLGSQPYRRAANLRKLFRETMAAAFVSPSRLLPPNARTLPPRKIAQNALPLVCRQFAASLSQAGSVRRGRAFGDPA